MRRSRFGGHGAAEFPSSGEDSFVAVVVTKLTGALLFLLLLVMVIMALLPKAVEVADDGSAGEAEVDPLAITTPGILPDAIAGRPYAVALAATGARGPLRWAIDGPLPEGLALEPAAGLLRGTPTTGTPEPAELVLRVTDGDNLASRPARLVVYEPAGPLTTPSRWAPGLPPIPWGSWLEQGFGFLVLLLVHMVGMSTLSDIERRLSTRAVPSDKAPDDSAVRSRRRRFAAYRAIVRLATLSALAGLAAWLWLQQHGA